MAGRYAARSRLAYTGAMSVACTERIAWRSRNAEMISKKPMMMNQTPTSTARTLSELAGAEVTTTPAMTLIAAKAIHQPLPSRTPPESPPDECREPLNDPGNADHKADERESQVQVADQDDADHHEQQACNAEPDPMSLVPGEHPYQVKDSRQKHHDAKQNRDPVSDPVGWKVTMTPSTSVRMPMIRPAWLPQARNRHHGCLLRIECIGSHFRSSKSAVTVLAIVGAGPVLVVTQSG